MQILVTGGTGYIGSHTCVELLNRDFEVIIVDNLSNSKREVVDKIEKITNEKVKFYEGDVADNSLMNKIFSENKIDAVIHFAGYKAVGESVKYPLMYYHNNLETTLNLLEVMNKFNCKTFIFSSSATVYGKPKELPIKETSELHTTNPYGTTKLMIETILNDLSLSDPDWCITVLRYFNPVGAHESGLIGENPNDIPNNLMPYIVKVACGELECLSVFGNDYDTHDGTGVRDYIHVVDLAKGHVKAIEYSLKNNGVEVFNLGTGTPYSVTEIVETFQRVNNITIKYEYGPRRAGDLPESYANAEKALKVLGWKTEKTLDDMCRDLWNWQKNNPNGFRD